MRVGGVDGHEATGAVEVEGKTDAVAEGEEERVAERRDAGRGVLEALTLGTPTEGVTDAVTTGHERG